MLRTYQVRVSSPEVPATYVISAAVSSDTAMDITQHPIQIYGGEYDTSAAAANPTPGGRFTLHRTSLDAGGHVVGEERYFPFGQMRWVSGTLRTQLTFNEKRRDSYSNILEMGAQMITGKRR